MTDPLHIPNKDLTVVYKGEEKLLLNKNLLDSQAAWSNLSLIKGLHVVRLGIEDRMDTAPEIALKHLFEVWMDVQYDLQKAWGFPIDPNYIREWDLRRCECPKLDNEDRYGTGTMVVSSECILHRDEV